MSGENEGVAIWRELTSGELGKMADSDPVAVLPLAAVEQHGPHLPLATDGIIGAGLLDAALEDLADEVPVLVLPTQIIGTSPEHASFPGTLSLEPDTLGRVLRELGGSLARAGLRRLVVSNSHGGNRSVVDTAALALRRDHGMLVVKAHYFRFPRPADVDLPEREWIHGLHGGALETAMMLHLRPDLVRREAIDSFPSLGEELASSLVRVAPEGQAAFAWSAEDLSAQGVVGDATLADADMGARLVRHYASCLADVIDDARRFPLERLGR